MHYYSHHIDSYTSSTRHLTPMEDLAYRRMLEVYYRDEGPLQGSAEDIARRICLREHVAEVGSVLKEFFVSTPDGWRQSRCDRELADYRQVVERNRANGVRGGRPKKPTGNPVETQSVPSGNPSGTHEKPTGNPPNPTPTPNPTPIGTERRLRAETPARPDDVAQDLWDEWTAFRRRKNAPVTQRVLDSTRKTAKEAGMSMAEALTHWIAQGHVGFFPPDKSKAKQDGGFDRFGKWQGVPRNMTLADYATDPNTDEWGTPITRK